MVSRSCGHQIAGRDIVACSVDVFRSVKWKNTGIFDIPTRWAASLFRGVSREEESQLDLLGGSVVRIASILALEEGGDAIELYDDDGTFD